MAIEFIIMPKESAVETAELILEIFTKYEPMTICNNVDKDKMLVLLNYLTQFGAEAELIVIARDIETNKIIGCITNKDFMLSPSPNLPEKYYSYISMFEADIAMCTELEEPLKNKNLVIGELFQSFHLCVLPEYKGRGIATKLVSEAITLAKRLGYRAIMAEC
jgi:GNAT superfamily N-acetyltransferase